MPRVFINEISVSQTNGSIEIAAVGETDLTGWQVVFYNFNSTTQTLELAGTTTLTDAATFGGSTSVVGFLTVNSNLPSWGMNPFSPGPVVALLDPYGNVVQAFTNGVANVINVGPAMGATPTVLPLAGFPSGSYYLTGTGNVSEDFTFIASFSSSLGAINSGQATTSRAFSNIFGTAANDTVDGTYGADNMAGNGGDDVVRGFSGNDGLQGNDGNDVLQGMRGIDSMSGGAGDDILSGGQGADNMFGETGNDIYIVDDIGDRMRENAGEGIDEVRSNFAVDLNETFVRNGPFGPETILRFGNIENVRLTGTADADATGDAGNNSIWGNAGGNVLSGGSGNDVVFGGNGEDVLYGDDGNDTLRGDGGNDVIIGGAGKDILFGGAGSDTFQFSGGEFAGLTLSTADRVRDFSVAQGDRVDLQSAGGESFIGTDAFTGAAGQVRYQVIGSNTMLTIDQNGDGVADAAIRFDGVVNFVADDILLFTPSPF